ncbi:hypothetical protein NEAUS04_0854 [Nematocida ausubeli]|uniref:Uncharacterized protein n=1 Tax=Nematocida ausubeli (strain ATCC PRA-371 / ERTm2) TaxID=1913371 RepID=A0A086J4G1_NEMA1|nr:uncharacterized protein NESG_00101 [Nematocida ausubeli]KAI5132451.1 hypothetical protein NEAUS06_0146 [Nematocida ausubeli]KAI5132779.1 hypothetical protein NEAUS07_0287 [Nematocida ausubeli]KAI5162067.1 hypothetical protein NEAUS04_0854 [Nematocida ausubeli]KFG27029.1 hypothetical protein NESG_00101 [Nematocida ausubeli]
MKILSSFGVILALSSALSGGAYAKSTSSQSGPAGVRSQTANTNKPAINSYYDDSEEPVALTKSQVNFITNFKNLKNANDVARELGLQTWARLTVYVRKGEGINPLMELGPNSKSIILNSLVDIATNTKPDSKDSLHTTLPAEYEQLLKEQQSTSNTVTTTTTTSTTNKGGNRSSSKGGPSTTSKGTAKLVEENVEEEEE